MKALREVAGEVLIGVAYGVALAWGAGLCGPLW